MLSTSNAMHREAITELLKSIGLWLATAGSAIGTFIAHALPLMQFGLCIVGLISGYFSIQASRATRAAIQKNTTEKPMKPRNIASLILIAAVMLSLSGCQTVSTYLAKAESKVSVWWASPTTQAGVKIAISSVESGLMNLGINVAEQELSGGKINWTTAGLSAGSAAVRSLELTPNAGNAAAITQTIMNVVEDPAQAKAIASQVVTAVATATSNGADPSGALEGAAQGLDKAAGITQAAATPVN